MDKNKLKDAVIVFLDDEIRMLKRCKHNPYLADMPWNTQQKCSLDRGLGVVLFVQELGLEYEEVSKLYEDFKAEVENI